MHKLQLIVDTDVQLINQNNLPLSLASVAAGLGGFVINGQAAGQASGCSVASAGDVNGDGLADLIVGAFQGGAGRSCVVFGKAGTAAIDLSAVASGAGGFFINGQTGGEFSGFSVSGAGDVNGDGLADLLVGTPFGGGSGRSHVVFGNADTAAVNLSAVGAGAGGGFAILGQAINDTAGYAVASAGDVNGDGLADLIVGAPSSDPAAGTDAGRSYVVFGQADTTAINLSAVAAGTGGFVINGPVAHGKSGQAVAGAGDVNGDGLADLIVGAPLAGSTGRSYVVFGKADTTAIDLTAVAGAIGGFVINGQADSDSSGFSVASAGDVNGDGLADLVVGALQSATAAGPNAGRSYVVFGKADTTAIDLSAVAAGTGGFVINGQVEDDNSGRSVASAGDVNEDGLADLIVGAYRSDPAAVDGAWRSYVVFGKADTTAIDLSAVAAGTGGFVINGEAAYDYSGSFVASAGDVNGDGLADLIVGAYGCHPAAGPEAGRSYMVFGKADTTAVDLAAVAAGDGGFVINGQAGGDGSGYSVASAGDLNGDGLADLIVGASSSDPAAGSNAGRSYVVFGKASTTAVDLASVAAGHGGFVVNGLAAGDNSGSSVASAGDVDGDGLADLIVGAPGSDPAAGSNAGRSYVLLSSQIGLGHFGAELARLGTAGADSFTGTSGAEVIYAGAGHDTILINASNTASLATSRIDGGAGRDTLQFAVDVTGTVDLRGLSAHALKGIEVLDVDNGAANTLEFNNLNLRSLHDETGKAGNAVNRLMVSGDALDAVQLHTSGTGTWSAAGTQVDSGTTYHLYAHSTNAWDRLWVEQGVAVLIA